MSVPRRNGRKRVRSSERRLCALPFAIRCKDCEEALEVAEEERVRDRLLMVGSHVER